MKPTPILEELKITIEGAEAMFDMEADDEHPDPIDDGIELTREAVELIGDIEKRHKKLCNVLREALAWCKQDATNEDCFPSQDMLDARVDALKEALKLARE
jgi:hypothetical protein